MKIATFNINGIKARIDRNTTSGQCIAPLKRAIDAAGRLRDPVENILIGLFHLPLPVPPRS